MKINKKIILMMLAVVLGLVPEVKAQNSMITVARAFYELARQNNTAKISNLLNRGYSLESVDEKGYNPVCLSVLNQNKQAYNVLTRYGAKESPECLRKVPADTYKKFFGKAPTRAVTYAATNTSDTPYLIGTALLGAGAVATAYILRGELKSDSSGGGGGGGGGGDKDRCSHGTKDPTTGKCECDTGYGNHGDDAGCYANVPNCATQSKATCTACVDTYYLDNNACYAPIQNCQVQTGRTCAECVNGYGINGGDGTYCYKNIEYCKIQALTVCSECIYGYGIHGGDGTECYKSIDHCYDQRQTMCINCDPGYSTYGNPAANVCYSEDPCKNIANTVPDTSSGEMHCVCNEAKGYYGEPGSCTQAEDEEYHEGDGNKEEWNNYNELYCNSHGNYIKISENAGYCECYTGYKNSSGKNVGCNECANSYLPFDGRCYQDKNCTVTFDPNSIQNRDDCVCKEGYMNDGDKCIAAIQCELYHKQEGTDCVCKAHFKQEGGECTCQPGSISEECANPCEVGYNYNQESDSCEKDPVICTEAWMGPECTICPMQYEITEIEGIKHCGNKCAENRKPQINPDDPNVLDCSECADNYIYSDIDNNCVLKNCPEDEAHILIDNMCSCNTEKGYVMTVTGECVLKGEDLIGVKDTNINNDTIELKNDGTTDGFHDVYGMKPVKSDDREGNVEYFDNVYNALSSPDALSSSEEQTGIINITNSNTGGNLVYGIYSPSILYNAASIMKESNIGNGATAFGKIIIKDSNTLSHIYGMSNESDEEEKKSMYNAFAYNKKEGSATEKVESVANALIDIEKDEESGGQIIGMSGGGSILNAYADTDEGIAANVEAVGEINLRHNGEGKVIGIEGTGLSQKINNSLVYLNSAISDALAEGTISVSGNSDVFGISGMGTIANSESQFKKHFVKVYNFGSIGTINATSHGEKNSAFGMYLHADEYIKAEIYNALGYNSVGNVVVTNDKGGNAYGIWHGVKLYEEQEYDNEGNPLLDGNGDPVKAKYYNNTYNAFRSSAKYGDTDIFTRGSIEINVSGLGANTNTEAVGIHAAGNVFNAYANSGSDVQLNSIGNITINDRGTNRDINLKGMESGGATIANAYAEGKNANTLTTVAGNIDINIMGSKYGASTGMAAGIYNDEPATQDAKVYNAALVNDKSNVDGRITITADSTPFNLIYGIYASRNSSTGAEEEGAPKIVYNAYYGNDNAEEFTGSVKGIITISTQSPSSGPASIYGISVNKGTAYNAYSTNPAANVRGEINIDVVGGASSAIVAGMYGYKSALYNSGSNSIINVTAKGLNARTYGLRGNGEGNYIENSGSITSTSQASEAYGIYINQGTAINSGVLNVSGYKGSYGIYAIAKNESDHEEGTATVINQGVINVSQYINQDAQTPESPDAKNIGIYADGSNVTVKNSGTININGVEREDVCKNEACEGVKNVAIMLLNDANLDNGGAISSTGNLDLSAMGGNIYLSTGGSFSAENQLSGDLKIATSTVENTFDNQTVLNNALSAQDISNLNVSSQSYLYNANVAANDNGQYDVVMQMKDFSSITEDESWATYLRQNYENQKNIALFNALKSASNATQVQIDESNLKGTSMLPNITEEELKVQRSLDTNMMNELFKEGKDIRKMVGGDAMRVGKGDHGTLTGYDINSESIYTMYDKKLNNRYRLGLGLSFTHTDTDYDNDSTRKNFMVQGYVPLTYNVGNGVTAVSMARVGYADGEYKRIGYNKQSYKADTSAITYGLLNEVRYAHDLGFAKLTPFVGLNASGWYQNSVNEGNENLALHMDATNVFSLESALGLYIDKGIEFNQDNILNIALGMGYYHEFADPYRGINAHHSGSMSNFRVKNKLNSRDRGVLSAKAEYDYKAFSIYGELMQYLEREYPIEVEGGIKYRF